MTTPEDDPPTDVWVDDRIVVGRSTIDGTGLFAASDIPKRSTVIRLGGRLVTSEELGRLIESADAEPALPFVDTITVFENRHLVLPPGIVVHFGNHSCDPNLWHVGPYDLATRRDVPAREELTVDYATHSGVGGLTMTCTCAAAGCRGLLTSDDWRRPDLQDRYRGHWTPALQQRIDRATADGTR